MANLVDIDIYLLRNEYHQVTFCIYFFFFLTDTKEWKSVSHKQTNNKKLSTF